MNDGNQEQAARDDAVAKQSETVALGGDELPNCGPKRLKLAIGLCGPRPSWKTIANAPAAIWKTSVAMPTCPCCRTCCRSSTMWAGPSKGPSRCCASEAEGSAQALKLGPMVAGLKIVAEGFENTLAKYGCTKIAALNQPFDPHKHQAILQQPNDKVPAGTVLVVAQQGYQLHDRVLRPAQVIVSTAG